MQRTRWGCQQHEVVAEEERCELMMLLPSVEWAVFWLVFHYCGPAGVERSPLDQQ